MLFLNYIQGFRDNCQIACIQELPQAACSKLMCEYFHNNNNEYRTLVNTNSYRKLITESIVDSDLAFSISIHFYLFLYSGHNPFWYTINSYFPQNNLSENTIESFLKLYKILVFGKLLLFLQLLHNRNDIICTIYPDTEPHCNFD